MQINNNDLFNQILQKLGYSSSSSGNSSTTNQSFCKVDTTLGADSNCCRDVNLDIPNGFQDIDPIFFLTLGEFIGNLIAGSLPTNITNAISNYLNLIGQVIETYAAQQLYFQNGPGRYYNCAYRNVGNPATSCVKESDTQIQIEQINKKLEELEESISKFTEENNRFNSKNINIDNTES